MKKHLNTLFVTTQGAYLSKEGETVVVKVEGEIRLRVPVHTIGGIVCFGNVSCSPYLMGFCAENKVAIKFLNRTRPISGQGPGAGFGKCSSPPGAIPPGGRSEIFGRDRKVHSHRKDHQLPHRLAAGAPGPCKQNGRAGGAQRRHAAESACLSFSNQEQPLDVLRGIEGDRPIPISVSLII